jgi:hypothetical protein
MRDPRRAIEQPEAFGQERHWWVQAGNGPAAEALWSSCPMGAGRQTGTREGSRCGDQMIQIPAPLSSAAGLG